MKKFLPVTLVVTAFLLAILTVSGVANTSRAHAAAKTSAANNCVSSGASWGQYTGTQVTVCKLGNGNIQTTTSAYGGCMLLVSFTVTYKGLFNPGQSNSSGQSCTSEYNHTYPPVHETGHIQVIVASSITILGGNEMTYASVDLDN